MSREVLSIIWRCADYPAPLLTAEDLTSLPALAATRLRQLGILREGMTASHVACDACSEGHVEAVDQIAYPDGQTRFFINCPENGRTEVPRERLLQWSVDYSPLLQALASALSARGSPTEVIPGRVWNLGRAALAGKSKALWAGRGLSWPDAVQVAAALPKGRSPVVFFIGQPPDDGLLAVPRESIIELRTVLHLDKDLSVDAGAIESQMTGTAEEPKKKQAKKQTQRDATVGALKRELHQRILSLKSALRRAEDIGEPFELPRLTQKDLAAAIKASRSAVSRAVRKSGDRELGILLQTAEDIDLIRRYSR
jgi:hypothetical protein